MNARQDRKPEKSSGYAVPALKGNAATKWTISGISPQTRAAVRKAAHKEGTTIGAWVDNTLQAAANNALKGGSPILALPPELLASIDDISRKLDQINRANERDPERFTSFAPDFGRIVEDLQKGLNDTVENLQKTATTIADSVSEQSGTAVEQSKQIAGKTLDRIADVGDAALKSVRQLRDDGPDDTPKSKTPKRAK